jgi:hypothetical protein
MDVDTASFVVDVIYLVKWQYFNKEELLILHVVFGFLAGQTTDVTKKDKFRETAQQIGRNVGDAASWL